MENSDRMGSAEARNIEAIGNSGLAKRLQKIVGEECIKVDEPMSVHTTFRVGGPADYFVTVKDAQELSGILKLCRELEVPFFLLGNGSNLLVGDRGVRGIVVQTQKDMGMIQVEGTKIRAGAGALLSKIGAEALANELTGFEFASGIPGTLGGACVMNAGAYGGEMKDILTEVTVLTAEGEEKVIPAEELELGYRTSAILKKNYIVTEAVVQLEKGDPAAIRGRMDELRGQRVTKQPLEYPSAGSTFKRPEGHFAGKLIQDAGLRGFRVGGAQVSEKHCGFVINKDHATAADIVSLMEQVSAKVEEQFGVKLEPEVKRIGEFD